MNADAPTANTDASRNGALAVHRQRALAHIRAARARLDDIALASDTPEPRDVDAADYLAEADELLTRMALW